MASPRPAVPAASWHARVSNEHRTALVTELYNELTRRESDRAAASARVRAWVAAANVELSLWGTSPDKESYVAGVRLKAAQWGAEAATQSPEHWATSEPVSPATHLAVGDHDVDAGPSPFLAATVPIQSDARDRGLGPPLTLKEQTHVAQHLALLDKQNLEIVRLYQRHFNEIQRLVNSQAVNGATPQECEFQKQDLQREQESARLQLQQLHELQQRELLHNPAAGRWGPLIRSPVDEHESMMGMHTHQGFSTGPVAAAGIATPGETSSADPSDLILSPLTISHTDAFVDPDCAGGSGPAAANASPIDDWTKFPGNPSDDLLSMVTFLPYTPPTVCEVGDLSHSPVAEDYGAPPSDALYMYSAKVSMLSPGGHTNAGGYGNDNAARANDLEKRRSLSGPAVVDLTAGVDLPETEGVAVSDGERRTTVNEALRLYYTSRVTELRSEYQSDLVALYRELRQMRKSPGDDPAQAQKIDALMVDIKKILVVLTRSAGDKLIADEHVEELDHVEAYIQRRVRPMSQRLKVKQAIFGDQRSVPAMAARTAQRQWQRFLRRMRDQQQQSPSSALPVNVSPPRRIEV